MPYEILVGIAAAGVALGIALAIAASRRPTLRQWGTPAFLLVAVAGVALALLLAGPIAFTLIGLS